MLLPFFQTQDPTFQKLQTQWRALLNPILANPVTNPRLLTNIPLQSGNTVINTGLAAIQQGWIITDINSAAIIYRSAPYNDVTLTLNSSAPCVVSLMVY